MVEGWGKGSLKGISPHFGEGSGLKHHGTMGVEIRAGISPHFGEGSGLKH